VALDRELRAELDAIGRVCFAVAPNRVHHLYAGEVARAYPEVRLWLAPGLERKRPDLVFEALLSDEAPAEWRGELDQTFFRGRPYENEVAFFHRASRTLVLCDLAFNFGPDAALATRLLMKGLRSYGRLGPSKLDPLLIRDRPAARASLERERSMGRGGASSQAKLDNAIHAAKAAAAGLEEARAALRRAELNLERTEIRAPFAGRVREKFVDVGQFVGTGARLARKAG